MRKIGGKIDRLFGAGLAAVIMAVDPTLIVVADSDEVGTQKLGGAFHIMAILFGRGFDFDLRSWPEKREEIEETLFPVLTGFEEIGREVGDVPRSVSQGKIAVAEPFHRLELGKVGEIRSEELDHLFRANRVVPSGTVEDVQFLAEPLKPLVDFKAGELINGFSVPTSLAT